MDNGVVVRIGGNPEGSAASYKWEDGTHVVNISKHLTTSAEGETYIDHVSAFAHEGNHGYRTGLYSQGKIPSYFENKSGIIEHEIFAYTTGGYVTQWASQNGNYGGSSYLNSDGTLNLIKIRLKALGSANNRCIRVKIPGC